MSKSPPSLFGWWWALYYKSGHTSRYDDDFDTHKNDELVIGQKQRRVVAWWSSFE